MPKSRIIQFLSLSILLIFLSGVQAQERYPTPSNEYAAASFDPHSESPDDPGRYSQYFTMPSGPTTGTHLTAPQYFDLQSQMPDTLYFSGQSQGLPYSHYQAAYPGGSSLWIQGMTSWTQSVVVPQGAFLSLLALPSVEGYGYLHETYPDGKLAKNYYYFYPANRVGFYADSIGQHILLFIIGDQVSNAVIINVVGNYPSGYQQPSYMQPVYTPSYYQPAGYLLPYPPFYKIPIYYHPRHGHRIDNESPHWDNVSPHHH